MSNLDEIVIHIATAPDGADDGHRITALTAALNGTVSWRYLARFTVPGHAGFENPTTGRQLSHTLVLQEPDWSSISVVVVLLRGRMPLFFDQVSQATIASWADGGPRLIVLEDLQRPPATSRQIAREHERIRVFADWIAQQPHAVVRQLQPGRDFDDVVRQALAGIARTRWLARYGIAHLVCRACGHTVSVDRGVGYCPHDSSVLVLAAAQDSHLPPQHGPYPLNGIIGRGAFGRIFLSMVPGQPPGALKTLLDPTNAQSAARLRRELELLGSIQHEHIVRLLEANEIDGSPVGLLEFLSGRPLKFVMGAISPRQILRFGLQLLSAVDALHRAGMIHRDLKPGNIMLVDDPNRPADAPRLVLLDFGLGKHQTRNLHENLTGTMLLGTPNYMAPEQLEARRAIDGRADIYSIGVILYQGVEHGQRYPIPPLQNPGVPAEVIAFIQRALQAEPRPLERPDVPAGVKSLILKALARRPADRFADAAEMSAALQRELAAWDADVPDTDDRSWLDWRPPDRYFTTHNWGPSSDPDALTMTVSSELSATPPEPHRGTARLDRAAVPQFSPVRPTVQLRAAEESPTTPAARHWRRGTLGAIAGLVGLGVIAGLLVSSMMSDVPGDARVVVQVTDQLKLPVEGVRVSVAGHALSGETNGRGELAAALPPPVDGRWSVTLDAPAGYVVSDTEMSFGSEVFEDTATHRMALVIENPYHLKLPGGSRLPVAVGDGSIRLLRSLRSSRLAWPDKPGVVTLKAGTEIYACGPQTVPIGVEPPPPARVALFLIDCFASADGEITLRIRRPDGIAPEDMTLTVVR